MVEWNVIFIFEYSEHFVFNKIVTVLFHMLLDCFLKMQMVTEGGIKYILTVICHMGWWCDGKFGFWETAACSEAHHSVSLCLACPYVVRITIGDICKGCSVFLVSGYALGLSKPLENLQAT